MRPIRLETGLIGKLRYTAKSIALGAWRLIPSDICFQQTRNLPMQGTNLSGSAINLLFRYTRFPAESEAMNVHTRHLTAPKHLLLYG